MKIANAPTIQATLFNSWQIAYQVPTKDGYANQETTVYSEEEANRLVQHHLALRPLNALKAYCKQQEHLISVLQLGNANRAKPMGQLHKAVTSLTTIPRLTPKEAAHKLQAYIMPFFYQSAPGRTSKFYQHWQDLENLLIDFINSNA